MTRIGFEYSDLEVGRLQVSSFNLHGNRLWSSSSIYYLMAPVWVNQGTLIFQELFSVFLYNLQQNGILFCHKNKNMFDKLNAVKSL